MKIAFLIHSWFPHGGQQRDMMRLARECLARGHDLTVHAMRWRGPRPDGLRVNLIEASALGRLSRYRRYAEQVRRALAADPVELVVGFNKMPLLDAYFAADPCFAEIAQNQRPAWYRYTPRFRHFSAWEQSVFGAESKTAVLLLTARQRDEYLRHYPDSAERLHLLPPGLAEERKVAARDPQARRRLRRELAIAERQTLILHVGSGFRSKGVDRSLRAFASLPERLASDCRFVLVGRPGERGSAGSRAGSASATGSRCCQGRTMWQASTRPLTCSCIPPTSKAPATSCSKQPSPGFRC